MLLNSVNPIDYVLDIAYNKKNENDTDIDKNTYKNLKQEEEEEEIIKDSNAINFTEKVREPSHSINTNDDEDDDYIIHNAQNETTEEHNQFYQPRTKSKLFNCIIDKLFLNLTKFLQLIGPLFCITIVTFIIYTYFSVLKNVFPYWYQNFLSYEDHKIFYIIFKTLMGIELFFTIFNNILSIIVKPGNVADLRKSKYYKTHSPYYSEELKFPLSFIKNNHINNNTTIAWRICKYCKEVKPLRTHHCGLCGTCQMKMDHHCPWINNCVGQNNHRYFLLFLFHVFCYNFLGIILTLPILIFNKRISNNNIDKIISKNKYNMREVRYISILGISGLIIETFFCGWNWFLAINGNTTLEFWADKTDFYLDGGINNYSFGNWRNNLFYVFGTTNLFKILFIPSIKKLPFSGLEISRFVDNNFQIEGIN
jgi:palmitoyltransferase